MAAFSRVFDAHWATVRAHIECHLDDEDEVSDLLAEVFSVMWAKLDAANPPGLLWLLRVTDNKLKDRDRSLRARAKAMDAISHREGIRQASDLLDEIAVRQAVATVLTPRERRFVTLFYWDRLSAGEIAEMLHCSQSVVFTALSRARAKLVVELGREARPSTPVNADGIARRAITLQTGLSSDLILRSLSAKP